MKQRLPLDIEMFPPFEGFPREGLTFLRQLKKNNNRDWFGKNKSVYEESVKLPMQSLMSSLQSPMAALAPEFDVNPKRSMFRIYRDTRFSKNKAPYKTHVAAVFHLKGHWEDSAGYYVHIEPGGTYIGGGIYMPDSDQLKKIRQAIAEHPKEFLAIVQSKAFKKKFGTLPGDKLQRAPLGYPADHSMIEWLKYKSFYTGVELSEKECTSQKFIDNIMRVYKDLLPFIRFLNQALKKS